MEILIDTNFILTCVKQKIDFTSCADELFNKKISWIVPKEVLEELKDISKRKGEKIPDKNSAILGIEIINRLNPKIIELKNKNVDLGIVNYIFGNDIILASLDRGLKSQVNNKILTIRGKNSLEIL